MGIITPSRNDLYQEETDFKSGASESMFTRFGATSNFINRYQHTSKEYFLNGAYRITSLSNSVDGLHIFQTNSEIVGVTLYNLVKGTAGSTQLNATWFDAPNSNQGSIFTTQPSFSSSSTDDSYIVKDLIDGNDINPTGTTLPVMAKTQFLKGEAIKVYLSSAMTGGRDCGMILNFRPIN